MSVLGIVLVVVVAGLVTWLCVDTIIYFVKKAKQIKTDKANKKSDDSNLN